MGTESDELLSGGQPSTLPPPGKNTHRRVKAQVLRNHNMIPMRMPRLKPPPLPEPSLPEMHWQDWLIATVLVVTGSTYCSARRCTPPCSTTTLCFSRSSGRRYWQ